METLTKENFWNEMEQKYPKAMAHFKEWVDKYKSEHNWGILFNAAYHGDLFFSTSPTENCPKYHELPIAIQFGIFVEYLYDITTDRQAFTIEMNTGYTGRSKPTLECVCRAHIPHFLSHLEGRL